MKPMRNIFWTIVLTGISTEILLLAVAITHDGWPSPLIIYCLVISSIASLIGAVLLSRLSWAYESPAAHSSFLGSDRAAMRHRCLTVRILMPLLAGGALISATWIFLFALLGLAFRPEGHELAFGLREALAALGILIFGFLLWSAGIGWGEDDYYWRRVKDD